MFCWIAWNKILFQRKQNEIYQMSQAEKQAKNKFKKTEVKLETSLKSCYKIIHIIISRKSLEITNFSVNNNH